MRENNNRYNNSNRNFDDKNPRSKPIKAKKSKRIKRSIKTTFLVFSVTFLVLVFAVSGAAFGLFMKIVEDNPQLDLLAIEPNIYTSIVYDMNKKEIDRFHGEENREYVTLSEIPVYLQNALVAVEDERFFSHNGIDIRGILRAGLTTIKGKLTSSSRVEGASTITQQLIKNNVTKVTRNTIKTKLQEIYLALNYEKQLAKKLGSKDAAKKYILELYLNTIALGHGYNGVQAAAIGYFDKNASELTLAECASIASITNNPSFYSPKSNPENNKKRQTRILNKMLEQNMVTEEEYNQAIKEDIYAKISKNEKQKLEEGGNIHSYFVDSVFEQVSEDLQEKHNISSAQANNLIYNGGLEIITTQDSSIQKILDETYLNEKLFPNVKYSLDVTYIVSIENKTTGKQKHSEYRQFVKNKEAADEFIKKKKEEIEASLTEDEHILADRSNISVQPQSAMVIMDQSSGEVRGLIGGRGEKQVNRGFNRAVNSLRQPGSVFKILAAFAPGLDLGKLTPATIIIDEPYTIGDYSPSNWYKEYRGASTVRDGIRDSMNIVAVKSMVETGLSDAYKYLLNFGFTSLENDKHASTALGGITKGVSQLELTAAYATIANGGVYNSPKLYKKVLSRDGEVLLDVSETNVSEQVLKESTAFILTDMMKDVVTSGTGAKAKFSNSIPIAGKTGTTQDSKDLTFVGYTPYYTAGIWLGYDRYDSVVSNMSNLSQSNHLLVWKTVMEKIHQNLKAKNFEKPSNIVSAVICKDTGLIAGEFCNPSRVRSEFFEDGTQPTEVCSSHSIIKICKDSNLLAGEFCPPESIITKVEGAANSLGDSPIPTSICDIHYEHSVIINPGQSSSNSSENKTPSLQTPAADGSSSSNDDIMGNIVPSLPTTEDRLPQSNQETNTPAPPVVEPPRDTVIEEPLIDSPR